MICLPGKVLSSTGLALAVYNSKLKRNLLPAEVHPARVPTCWHYRFMVPPVLADGILLFQLNEKQTTTVRRPSLSLSGAGQVISLRGLVCAEGFESWVISGYIVVNQFDRTSEDCDALFPQTHPVPGRHVTKVSNPNVSMGLTQGRLIPGGRSGSMEPK